MSKDIAIKVDHLSKDFLLPHDRKNTLKEWILHFHKQKFDKLHALDDIDFEIKRGEFFGIVGRNGSGKSTLLKIIGGIYQPTRGKVTINGTLTPFIELGIGFNPELTGRENIYLNGAILGLTHKEIAQKYDEIVNFAELPEFMDQRLKNYSSGMQVRLAFSIAIQAHNDILLIDEVLAVGDAAFQRKCFGVFNAIKKSGRTVVFVTHDMGAVQEYCTRALMIEDSKMVSIGDPREVALHYTVANSQDIPEGNATSARPSNPAVRLDSINLESHKKWDYIKINQDIVVEINFTVRVPTEIQFNVFLTRLDGKNLAGVNSTVDLGPYKPKAGKHSVTCTIKSGQLSKGEYKVNAALYTYCEWPSSERPLLIDVLDTAYGAKVPTISLVDISKYQDGEFFMKAEWKDIS